ncbi:hypothetical protein IGB42_03569 [Andreprevotia sp. IGB-42]|uniref:hypothetical protein n=1 Tax=Andreprevotia sp. IGB-42 TaxID=2497473 RepID=UPI00135CCB3A|nr:hypothetical protein [Andreprevotia sp. IGB-42]KAF0812027.1 hypothetical protein IGB42_03569 [Andreprevotia sp. IGB-42]
MQLIEQMVAWLQQQPGFCAYEFYQGEHDCLDRLAWHTQADCIAGALAFMRTEMAAQLMALCDDDISVFFGEAAQQAVALTQ